MPNPHHVYIAEGAADSASIMRPAFEAFARDIGRPIMVLADHVNRGITPAKHLEHYEEALRLDSGLREAVEAGLRPYVLHFYQVPTLKEDTGGHFAHHARLDGRVTVLDWRWPVGDEPKDAEYWRVTLDLFDQGLARASHSDPGHMALGKFLFTISDFVAYYPNLTQGDFTSSYPADFAGAIVAQSAAFIPRDVIHSSAALPLLERLLEQIRPTEPTPEEIEEQRQARARIAEARRLERIDGMIDSAKAWVQNLGQGAIAAQENQINNALRDIRSHRDMIMTLSEQMRTAMAMVDALKRQGRSASPSELKNLRQMLKSGILKDITFGGDTRRPTFTIITRPLLALDDRSGAYHKIGRMQIEIGIMNGAVSFYNLDGRTDAFSSQMNAPHVWSSGEACLGNFSEAIAGLMVSFDWYAAIELCIAFIESANTDDPAGSKVHMWPFVTNPEEYGYPAYEGLVEPFADPEPEEDDEDPYPDTYVNEIAIIVPNGDGDWYRDEFNLAVGERLELGVEFTDADGDYDSHIRWRSSDTTVALVDATGTVEALHEGSAAITATHPDSGRQSMVRITVEGEA